MRDPVGVPRTRVKDRSRQLDVTEMTRALGHAFTTGLALEVAVDGAHAGVVDATRFKTVSAFVIDLGKLNFRHRVGFLYR